jgi:hypothetical protein
MQLLSLIPWQGIVRREGESILLLMRAIRNVMILVALFMGLPTLAHAHSGHDHQQASVSQRVQLQASTEAVPSSTLTMEMVAAAATHLKKSAKLAVTRGVSQHAVMVMSNGTSMHACVGGCCCSGAAGCGAGSCCPTFIPSASVALHVPAAAELVTSRLYHSASLLVILGLDRPPKA